MTFNDFKAKLNAISKHNGHDYGRVFSLFDAQEEYMQEVTKYQEYLTISDGFKSYFLETVELLNNYNLVPTEQYRIFIQRMVYGFQSFCGAETIALRGYPMQAYILLRNIYDDMELTSAVMQKMADFYYIQGIEPGQGKELASVTRLRKRREADIRKKMSGNMSGLSPSTVAELARWDRLFDYETHGGRLSLAQASGWISGEESLAVSPLFNEREYALFTNRASEISWMIHRLIPLIQPPTSLFPDDWKDKWCIIDDCFDTYVSALTIQLGKRIGTAIVEYVKAKYPFDADSVFPLTAGI